MICLGCHVESFVTDIDVMAPSFRAVPDHAWGVCRVSFVQLYCTGQRSFRWDLSRVEE